VILRAVGFVMQLTPFGVFALVANAVAANGVGVIADIRWLALGVVLFVILQIFIVHASLLALIAKRNIFGFLRSISDALAIAFSTSSSAATLPVALRVAEERLGLPKAVAATTLPLGASIGKDGTAAYVGLLSIFALQALGVPITPAALAIILLAGSFAAFGTAPMPSASLFMLAAVLSAVGVDPAHTALVVAFVLPFDRLLDMTRTIASASANLTVATVVTALAPEVVDEVGEDQRAD
jgi:Na+/H+-dicarboxylate symporter